jgi:phosphate/phosphite/phosphonate ABC transporter binding protein
VRLGVIPSIGRDRTQVEFEPLARYLGEVLHRPSQLVIAQDYADIRQMLEKRQVDVAILFPLTYAEAEATVPGLALIACSVRQGKPAYRGYILTRREAPYQRLEDLKGQRFAFVDRNSTSGYLYPLELLRARGLVHTEEELATFFREVQFRKSHDNVLRAVVAGEVEAGAVYDGALAQAARLDIDSGALRILARTEPIPHEAVVTAPGVPEAEREALRQAFLALDTRSARGRSVLRPLVTELKFNGFVACEASHFDSVRRVRGSGP